ncbi:MAG TPA: MauE/DoxX family redox-associated membrane protein [Acidimicrobiales bacterium]|nr:MauE/DoxX family redox-associated membrane protein [Acidimicrobiales bacterium]
MIAAATPLAAGPFLAAAVLLLAAGALKVARPHSTGVALRRAGLGVPDAAVRAGAAVEVAVAVAAMAGLRTGAVLIAASYLGFAGFVAAGLRRGSPVSSCGCFGEIDAPPTVAHLVLNVAAALAAVAGAARPVSVAGVLHGQPLAGMPFAALVGVLAYGGYLVMAVLPRTVAAGDAAVAAVAGAQGEG